MIFSFSTYPHFNAKWRRDLSLPPNHACPAAPQKPKPGPGEGTTGGKAMKKARVCLKFRPKFQNDPQCSEICSEGEHENSWESTAKVEGVELGFFWQSCRPILTSSHIFARPSPLSWQRANTCEPTVRPVIEIHATATRRGKLWKTDENFGCFKPLRVQYYYEGQNNWPQMQKYVFECFWLLTDPYTLLLHL